MEKLEFVLEGHTAPPKFAPILVGVVGSGNLEVMMEWAQDATHCTFTINTSARGFRPIWEAVVQNFHAQHQMGGVLISVNDMGATPAVVSLRLDQAAASLPRTTGPTSCH
jgi:malonate decarboxylase delta subunit